MCNNNDKANYVWQQKMETPRAISSINNFYGHTNVDSYDCRVTIEKAEKSKMVKSRVNGTGKDS